MMNRQLTLIISVTIVFLCGATIGLSGENAEDAPLPNGEKLRWGEEPLETLSAVRDQICLNGIWKFVPVIDPAETQPPGGFAYIRVPGSWKPTWLPGLTGLLLPHGKGPAWKKFDPEKTMRAWYQRSIKIPAQWAGRAILISLERVSTDAIIFANGVKCGAVSWPYGEVDISSAVKPGEEATLSIQVIVTSDKTDSKFFLDAARVVTAAPNAKSHGLIGDVILYSRPQGAHVSDVFVQTSTRKKELKLDVELSAVKTAGPINFTARILDAEGKEAKRFQTQAQLDGSPTQTMQLTWTWENPRLWDVQQANLYTLKLAADGKDLKDEYSQTFGFREFWIDGRKLFLNGTEIHLRPIHHDAADTYVSGVAQLIDEYIDGCVLSGFNSKECWPIPHDERGLCHFRELWSDRADRKGFLLLGTAEPVSSGEWNQQGYKEYYAKQLERDLRRYRNHPSIVIYTTNPNWLGHGLDQDPRYIGRNKELADPEWLGKVAVAKAAMALIKKNDPTRPVLNHAGSTVGDIYNVNCYLNMIPLQEREEWLSEWTKTGDMPLMCVEFGTPWKWSLARGRWGLNTCGEPLATEYCAIYQGPEAYALEDPAYRRSIAALFQGGMVYKQGDYVPDRVGRLIDFGPSFQKLEVLFIRNTYRSWRTMGISGGMLPWDYGYGWDAFLEERRRKKIPDVTENLAPFKPGLRGVYVPTAQKGTESKMLHPGAVDIYPSGTALMEANGPTLAWIAGGKEFTSKDHNFFAGATVEKQVVLINDERSAQPFSYSWTVQLDGKQIATDSGKGSIEMAKTLFESLRFQIPQTLNAAKAAGTIALTAKIGTREHTDTFAFRAFAKPTAVKQTAAVYDPAGITSRMLTSIGCATEPTKAPRAGELMIVGREALSGGTPLPFDLEATVRDGAHVLVFAQNPNWIRKDLGLRVAAHLARRVYPVNKEHPVLKDLDAVDLSDWAGVSTLVQPFPEYGFQAKSWRSPDQGWHWGNRGAVCSAAIEKPHCSGWRPILECEFDLAYSPLMELDYGQGRLIWCTLDLEDHVELDPAAALLAHNLIEYAATTKPLARAKRTVLIGADSDKKLLDGLGAVYEPAEKLAGDADLAIFGRQAKYADAEIQTFLEKGGKVLFLSRNASDHGLNTTLELSKGCSGGHSVPDWPECQGLSVSDVRWRSECPAWLLKSGPEIGADGLLGCLRKGKGVAIFCQFDPDRFDADTKTYFRFTRWRQTRAIAQILANLGASFSSDKKAVSFAKRQSVYHPDYRDYSTPFGDGDSAKFQDADDPYRYFRW